MAKTSEAQLKAAEKYMTGQRQIVVRVSRTTEEDILAWLEKQDSMQRYIKALVEADMKRRRIFQVEDESGDVMESGLTWTGAISVIDRYEKSDKAEGIYEAGAYYIRNAETDYCEHIIN